VTGGEKEGRDGPKDCRTRKRGHFLADIENVSDNSHPSYKFGLKIGVKKGSGNKLRGPGHLLKSETKRQGSGLVKGINNPKDLT